MRRRPGRGNSPARHCRGAVDGEILAGACPGVNPFHAISIGEQELVTGLLELQLSILCFEGLDASLVRLLLAAQLFDHDSQVGAHLVESRLL